MKHPGYRSALQADGGIVSAGPVNTGLVPFPFAIEFQTKLLKVIMLDTAGPLVIEHVKPEYFEGQELRWIYAEIQTYWKQRSCVPSWTVLRHRAHQAGAKMKDTILHMIDFLDMLPVKEEEWIREQVLEWVRENIFHTAFKETKALWDNGKRREAMLHMDSKMENLEEAVWRQNDRGWFFEELSQREGRRQHEQLHSTAIATGIPQLDDILDGGLSLGELGIWIAYAKGGKSTMLLNHGANAVRIQHKKVLHFVLEGSRSLIENRYDAWFSNVYYNSVKKGNLSEKAYAELIAEYKYLQRCLVIQGMTSKWNYTILDVQQTLDDLRRSFGWKPDLIIIDYADLLRGREGPYQANWMSERDAIRDMKLLALRGYALWTASQAQRPESKNFDTKEHLIKCSQIAGGIEKVRVADFIGSCNATLDEKANNKARLFAELYRDNEAGKVIEILTELAKMKMGLSVKTPPNDSIGMGPKVSHGAPSGWVQQGGVYLPQYPAAPPMPAHFSNPSPVGVGPGFLK